MQMKISFFFNWYVQTFDKITVTSFGLSASPWIQPGSLWNIFLSYSQSFVLVLLYWNISKNLVWDPEETFIYFSWNQRLTTKCSSIVNGSLLALIFTWLTAVLFLWGWEAQYLNIMEKQYRSDWELWGTASDRYCKKDVEGNIPIAPTSHVTEIWITI